MTLIHEGNEYHIMYQGDMYTHGYREMGHSHIEIIKRIEWKSEGLETEFILSKVPVWLMKEILAHQEQLKEIEAQEGQEILDFEHMEAIGL